MDRFDRATRSRVMSRNKSSGTKSTERTFWALLVRAGISGWELGHRSELPGRPDVIFRNRRLAVFVDGCFWHGCRCCRTIPTTNRRFWTEKIGANKRRDRKAVRSLRSLGWWNIGIWEHDLRGNRASAITRVKAMIEGSQVVPGSPRYFSRNRLRDRSRPLENLTRGPSPGRGLPDRDCRAARGSGTARATPRRRPAAFL